MSKICEMGEIQMKRIFKKAISVVLVMCVMLTGIAVGTVGASAAGSSVPIVYLCGAGSAIYEDENDSSSRNLDAFGDGSLMPAVSAAMSQMIKPLINAYINNNFDAYCDELVSLYSQYFSAAKLDENGEASNGSGNRCIWNTPTADRVSADGTYSMHAYQFEYDWRVDPFETAVHLNEYIEAVKATTHSEKVNIVCRCLGVNETLAYVAAYGSDSLNKVILYTAGFDGFTCVSALFTGDIQIDADALERYANATLTDAGDETQKLIKSILQVANNDFMLDWGIDEVMDFYEKIYENVVPRMLKESYATYVSYWSMVDHADYEKAIEFNFGSEREKYAKLIEKADRYQNEVAGRYDELLADMQNNGVEVYIVAKYGYQLIPISEEGNMISDQTVTVKSASGGADTALMTEKFSDDYMKKAELNGTAKYISADRQINSSTSVLPEYTWYIKNLIHKDFPDSVESDLFMTLLNSDTYMTVFDDASHPQYMIYNSDTNALEILTAENSETAEEKIWKGDKGESVEYLTNRFLNAILKFFELIKDFVYNLLNGIMNTK